jgi:hypothetical protein
MEDKTTCRLSVSQLDLVGMLTTKETVAIGLAGSLVAMCLNGVFERGLYTALLCT